MDKETPDNIRLRNMIKIVGNNNMTALPAWRKTPRMSNK